MSAAWQGKWALVTGASAGIGREIAKQLAVDGANLVLVARRADRLAQLAGELTQKQGTRCEICVADLTHPQAPQEVLRFTQEKDLAIEVLINNAGFGINGEFLRADPQRLLDMVQVNVASVMHLARLFLPAMVQRQSGYMMVVASTAAFQAVPYLSTYAATKGFDLLFAEGIAAELAAQGVRVCALCPGGTDTEFQQVAGQTERMARAQESAEKVARVGLQALAAGKPMVISGLKNRLAMESQRLAPRSWVTRAVARMFKP
jgi:short-subunit dehydrogenase